MSRINNEALVTWSNNSTLENEINSRFSNNPDFDINDIIILAEITPYSYYPIETAITDNQILKVKQSLDYINLNLYVCSRRQFIHDRFTIEEDTYKIELSTKFKTAWNKNKFLIFQDGYLMNNGLFTFIIPSFDNTYLKKMVYSTAKFKQNSRIDIYYIESEDFNALPISRDVYLGALKYIARKNNEKLIPIPYPNNRVTTSFFIFNENGEYLDEGVDYVISYDKRYITLRKPLKLATVDYIIFSFPQLAKDAEFLDSPEFPYRSITGSPFFKYSYSIPYEYNETGLVRFYPVFDEYYITKKNILLFGNGEWIHPDRFEIHSNDAIIFNTLEDQKAAANTNYTMVIFADNTDHSQYLIPRDMMVLHVEAEEPNQKDFDLTKVNNSLILDQYKTFIIYKDKQVITDYIYDDDLQRITFSEPVNTDFYIIYFSSVVNNEDQDAFVHAKSFECNPNIEEGTSIPDEYDEINLTSNFNILFVNDLFIPPESYNILDKRIYLSPEFCTTNSINLEGAILTVVFVIGGYNKDSIKLSPEEIEKIKEWQDDIDYNSEETAYFYTRKSSHSKERGVIYFDDDFSQYNLTKRNMLLFSSGGLWIDPSRFEVVNNDKLYFINPIDHERALFVSAYYAVTFNDKKVDEKYSPPNILIRQVVADEDNQSIFKIPKVYRRFKTFILFRA